MHQRTNVLTHAVQALYALESQAPPATQEELASFKLRVAAIKEAAADITRKYTHRDAGKCTMDDCTPLAPAHHQRLQIDRQYIRIYQKCADIICACVAACIAILLPALLPAWLCYCVCYCVCCCVLLRVLLVAGCCLCC